MSDYRQNNPEYNAKDKNDARERMSDYRQNNPEYKE